MKNIVNTYVERFKADHRKSRRTASLLLTLALIVAAGVFWQLHSTGIALTNETYCGLTEHQHSENCYEDVLVCGLEESEGHTHSEECYETQTVLVCGLEESEGHTHDESCYDEEGNLVCGLEESEGHTHSEDCYETEQVLICGLEESEGHTHSEECYESQLVCGLEEHTHTVECMSDETANVETSDDWEATLPTLTGVWADDVVAIAESQLGYTESTKNFTLADDGETRQGYTRYGAWAGNAYGDWDAMFASFCLYYAGISTDDFPEATGAYAWSVKLQDNGLYADASEYTPTAGDLVFFDMDGDGKIDSVGVIAKVNEDAGKLTVIEGDYEDGDADAVCENQYSLGDSTVIGYGILPEQETGAETETNIATLTFEGDDYIVTVAYDDDAELPENTELVVSEYDKNSETYRARNEEAAALYGWDADAENDFRLFNIGLYCDGTEIEPAAEVTITVTYTGETNAASVSVTHFGNTATETLDATLTDGDDSQSVTFTADGFSDYGIMLTADAATYTVEIENSIATDGKLTAVITDSEGNNVNYSSEYTYTWYRSKEPYLTDSKGNLESAPETGYAGTSINNYNYLLYNSSGFGATVNDDGSCTVGKYVFYYYYVNVKIGSTTYTSEPAYASVDGAASYVTITNSDNTLTAKLYDSNGAEIDPSKNSKITYTYTWYKSRTYEAANGTTESEAPYANTINNTNDYVAQSGSSASLALEDNDSFYFYYVIVTMKYTLTDDTTSYTAYAKGYEDWTYAGLISSSDYTAVIVDDISSEGTFDAVLYNGDGKVVDTSSNYTFTWYKSVDEYLTASSSYIYSDQTYPSSIDCSEVTDEDVLYENTVNVAKDLGGLHYYYVIIKDSEGNEYTSAVKYVQYSDQIENGGFENCSDTTSFKQQNELAVVNWRTTNGEYTENHGSYRGCNSIEIGLYGGSTALGTYSIAYSKAGDTAGNYFAELNATEDSTLYQTVITAPGTIYYWSVYHQNRSYNTSTGSAYQVAKQENVTLTDGSSGTLTTYETTGTDSMYVIIMSDEDAEKLLAEVDNSTEYSSQQDVIDAAAEYIIEHGTQDVSNGSVTGSDGDDEISCSYTGSFPITDGTVNITLWQATTAKTVTRVILTDSNNKKIDATSLADAYPTIEGWAPLTSSGTTYGYYKVSDWVKYSGSYTVPDGQYLTRFFFAAASAQGGNAAGNFIDSVSLTASVDYTIEYWVWNGTEGEYLLQNTDTEKGTVSPYTRVYAGNLGNYLEYVVVGSVTSDKSGGTNPTEFDSSTKRSIKVDAYTNYLSIYLSGTGVTAEKVISGLSSAALSTIEETVNFTITDSGSKTTTLTVTLEDTYEASKYTDTLGIGTYTISESGYSASLLDKKYLWVRMSVNGATESNGTYTFELSETNPSQTITFTNYYLPVVTLKKVDSTYPSKTLSDVKFEMYKIDGSDIYYYESYNDVTHEIKWSNTEVSLKTDTDGTIAYSALPDGTYYLKETETVDGYNLLTETLSFTIKDGAITAVDGDAISIDSTDPYSLTILVKNDPGVELPNTGGVGLPAVYTVGSLMILASAIGLVVRRKKI